jgi:hypothetical protein
VGQLPVADAVGRKEIILPSEERRLSIFRWIGQTMPRERCWYPVFQRYLDLVALRATALGGDPDQILPSPSGDGRKHRGDGERRRTYTGLIDTTLVPQPAHVRL